jgi:hypothetical protein
MTADAVFETLINVLWYAAFFAAGWVAMEVFLEVT